MKTNVLVETRFCHAGPRNRAGPLSFDMECARFRLTGMPRRL